MAVERLRQEEHMVVSPPFPYSLRRTTIPGLALPENNLQIVPFSRGISAKEARVCVKDYHFGADPAPPCEPLGPPDGAVSVPASDGHGQRRDLHNASRLGRGADPEAMALIMWSLAGDRVRRGEREDSTPPRCAPSWSPSNATRSAAASPRSSLLPRDSRGGMSGRRPVILLVEDAEVNRVVVRRMVRELGVGLEEAENGEVAVELLRRGRHYDLILMDKDMPVMDGHEATRQLRSLGVRTPIVALSGNGLPSNRELFFRAGADEFQMKPLSMAGLAALLARHGLS